MKPKLKSNRRGGKPSISRQAQSIKRLRPMRRLFRECVNCGKKLTGKYKYRCGHCNEVRRDWAREAARRKAKAAAGY